MEGWILTLFLFLFLMLNMCDGAVTAKSLYSMNLQKDCISAGRLDVPRDQTTMLNGLAASGPSSGQTASCRLQFGPQESSDTLKVTVMPGFYIENCATSLTIRMGSQSAVLGCQTSTGLPSFEGKGGDAVIEFRRGGIGVTNYYFQISVYASRGQADPGAVSSGDSSDVGLIVGIVAAVVAIVIIACIICICCRKRRRERLAEKRQFVNGTTAAGAEPQLTQAVGMENGTYDYRSDHGPYSASPGSQRKLLAKKESSEEGGDNSFGVGEGKGRSALDRFGPPPSRRRGQQIGPNDREAERPRDAFTTESEVRRAQPRTQTRVAGFGRGQSVQDYEDIDSDRGGQENQSPPRSPILSDLRSNPKFRRSFHETEADADDRARRVSDQGSSGDSQDSRYLERGPDGRPRKPQLPPVPRSPPRSPSPQRRGEKIAAIYRSRPSSSYDDAARLDSDRSNDTPDRDKPRQERDTRHTLRPNRNGKSRSPERSTAHEDRGRRGRNKDYDDYTDEEEERERERQQRRRDREDEEKQRRRRQEEEEEKEEEERLRKEEKKRKEEERRRREKEEEEEERRRKKRAATESEGGSEYEGRFKKSTSGRRSKGKGPKMGRSRSTGNALEEMEENYKRSRSKSPGSAHSLNFIEDDETDLDSNYLPFRRAGSKTSLYASRSSLYGRRRKNSMGETVSVSSRTALDDTDSRIGDFDHLRMSKSELNRMFKSTGELEKRPESAHVVREVGTSTARGGSVGVYGRKTVAKGRRGKRYSRGTQTPSSSSRGRRRDSVGSAKSGKSTSSRNKLKSKSRSRESLGGRRSRSRGLTDEDDDDTSDREGQDDRRRRRTTKSRSREKLNSATSEDSGDDRSKRSGRSNKSSSRHKPKKSNRSLSDDSANGDHIADDQSVAPSSIYGATTAHPPNQYPYGAYPQAYMQPMVAPAPGYPPPPPQLIYQPIVAPGGPPPMPTAADLQNVQLTKPPVAPKPQIKSKQAGGSRWNELVNLTEGMKQRRRQMGESVTEDGTESVLSSMWSHPTYLNQQSTPPKAPPSYTTAQGYAPPDLSYSSNYADSTGYTPPRDVYHSQRMASYSPSESNI